MNLYEGIVSEAQIRAVTERARQILFTNEGQRNGLYEEKRNLVATELVLDKLGIDIPQSELQKLYSATSEVRERLFQIRMENRACNGFLDSVRISRMGA